MTSINPMSRLRSLRVIDVMNRSVVKVSAQQTMTEIAKEFFDHDISAAPVVNEFDQCVGILSATDFLRRDSGSDDQIFRPLRHSDERRLSADADVHGRVAEEIRDVASSFMTRTVRTVYPHTTLLNAAILMNAEHIHRLPVVDDKNRVVGMISTMDIVAAVVNAIDEMDVRIPERESE